MRDGGYRLTSLCYYPAMRIAVILFLFLLAAPVSAQRSITTIELQHAAPQQLAQVLAPYLSPGSSARAYQGQLILHVTPQELETARELLRQLDEPARQLLISLRIDGSGSDRASAVDVDTVLRSGDVTLSNDGRGVYGDSSRTTVRVQDRQTRGSGSSRQAVRATEGLPAYIATGVTAPLQGYSIGADGRRYYQRETLDAVTGFYATTWVNGDTVRVSIDQGNDQLQGRTINTQQLRTEVSGALGAWLPLGEISETASQRGSDIGSLGLSGRARASQIYIKVEEVR